MISILTSDSVPAEVLGQLRDWFVSEWGDIDPFEGNHPDIPVPSPIVAVDEKTSLMGGLSFTSAAKPQSAEIGIWINMVLISPDHRMKGIASQLVQSAEMEAKRNGVHDLFVLSEYPSLYQKLGWRFVGMDRSGNETILRMTM